jgi:hypothetical protein
MSKAIQRCLLNVLPKAESTGAGWSVGTLDEMIFPIGLGETDEAPRLDERCRCDEQRLLCDGKKEKAPETQGSSRDPRST